MILYRPKIKYVSGSALPLNNIEVAARTCYKSEDKIKSGSAEKLVDMLLSKEHTAMLEFAYLHYWIRCDRGVSHEIVRHRLFSYAQESTRYCDYEGGVGFIIPSWNIIPDGFDRDHDPDQQEITLPEQYAEQKGCPANIWAACMLDAETAYKHLRSKGWKPQQARSVLPNSLKTEIHVSGNLREWLHFFKLRTAKAAHPDMQLVANMILEDAKGRVPLVFDKI